MGQKFTTEFDPSVCVWVWVQLNFNVELVATVLGYPKSLYTEGMDILVSTLKQLGFPLHPLVLLLELADHDS